MTTMNIYDLSDVWNAGGTTFTAIKMNVTDTASAAGSLLMDLQVGGSSRFTFDKAGGFRIFNSIGNAIPITYDANARLNFGPNVAINAGNNQIITTSAFGLGAAVSSVDVILTRDAANTLAQRNGVNAQAFRVYGTFTDASNSRRLVMTMSAAGVAAIRPEGLGSGLTGNVLHISGLPTANPGPGILWNSSGFVVVGT